MIKAVPHTEYELAFHDEKPMPLYMYYCLLGQDYEVLRNDSTLLTYKGADADSVLETFRILLNGYPQQEDCYYDPSIRTFNVKFNDDGEVKLARACFYFDDNALCCKIQRGHYGKDHGKRCTHIEYDPSYECCWNWDDLDWYGLVEYAEEDVDD